VPIFIGRGAPLYDFSRFRCLGCSAAAGESGRLHVGNASFHAAMRRTSLMVTSPALFSSPTPIYLDMTAESGQKTHQPFEETSVNFPPRIFDDSGWVAPIRRAAAR
jgi:hypothetical protein